MQLVEEVLDGIFLVDTGQFGVPAYGGAYVVRADQPALVDCGTSLAAGRILSGLRALAIPPEQVRWALLTHIHPDHAGGAGALLPRLTNAQVVVHPRGLGHLADPTRLAASARKATGSMAGHYGTFFPIPRARLCPAEDGTRFDLGDARLRAVAAPGHAPHHLCFLEERSGALFTGDAVGLWRKGALLPATVPPQFDLAASLDTLDRLQALRPRHLLFTHFGLCSDGRLLQRYGEVLLDWVRRVRSVLEATGNAEETVRRLLADPELERLPFNEAERAAELAMSIRGVVTYLGRQAAPGR
ncbi:MAG: MBL fold metallo-hydrolase [Candidatus Bipolaricaulaceae bacterium]